MDNEKLKNYADLTDIELESLIKKIKEEIATKNLELEEVLPEYRIREERIREAKRAAVRAANAVRELGADHAAAADAILNEYGVKKEEIPFLFPVTKTRKSGSKAPDGLNFTIQNGDKVYYSNRSPFEAFRSFCEGERLGYVLKGEGKQQFLVAEFFKEVLDRPGQSWKHLPDSLDFQAGGTAWKYSKKAI